MSVHKIEYYEALSFTIAYVVVLFGTAIWLISNRKPKSK